TSAGSVVTGWPPPEHRAQVAAVLAEPLADELTRGEALRWGALLHDVAKPLTRRVRPSDGRVTFIGHDSLGAGVARVILARRRARCSGTRCAGAPRALRCRCCAETSWRASLASPPVRASASCWRSSPRLSTPARWARARRRSRSRAGSSDCNRLCRDARSQLHL